MNNILSAIHTGEFGITEFFISISFSTIAGITIALLYRIYFTQALDRNSSLAKSFVIIAPSISAIFWAIQYSLPLSLGLLGALSFVRFRTPIKNAEDIGFILLTISISLLSSVYRFTAASMLLGLLILIIVVKSCFRNKFMPFFQSGTSLTIFIATNAGQADEVVGHIKNVLLNNFSDIKDRHILIHDIIPKDESYHLRMSVYCKKYDEMFIPKISSQINGLDCVESVEIFKDRIFS